VFPNRYGHRYQYKEVSKDKIYIQGWRDKDSPEKARELMKQAYQEKL